MTVNPAPDHLEVTLNGAKETLFMSYGLLNRLTTMLNGAENVPLLANDSILQEKVILEVFTKRDKKQVVYQPTDLDEFEVSLSDIGNVLDWVGAHVTDFFLQTTEKTMLQALKSKARVESLAATASGFSQSPSLKPAA